MRLVLQLWPTATVVPGLYWHCVQYSYHAAKNDAGIIDAGLILGETSKIGG